MKKEEQDKLIEYLAEALDCWKREAISTDEKIQGHEMHDRIVVLVKKEVTKDEKKEMLIRIWVEEKAKELITMVANLYPHEASPCVVPKGKARDFIRLLVKEISVLHNRIYVN